MRPACAVLFAIHISTSIASAQTTSRVTDGGDFFESRVRPAMVTIGCASAVAALPAISPKEGIGRGMKVARRRWSECWPRSRDISNWTTPVNTRNWEAAHSEIIAALANIPGLKAKQFVPEIANHVPHADVTWSESGFSITAAAVAKQLLEGEPSIAVAQPGERHLRVSVWMMRPGEHRAVARRLREIFVKV